MICSYGEVQEGCWGVGVLPAVGDAGNTEGGVASRGAGRWSWVSGGSAEGLWWGWVE